MATPHVAGLAAYLLTLDSSLTAAAVDSTIKSRALNNVISGIREFIGPQHLSASYEANRPPSPIASGTINALINNGL